MYKIIITTQVKIIIIIIIQLISLCHTLICTKIMVLSLLKLLLNKFNNLIPINLIYDNATFSLDFLSNHTNYDMISY